MVIILEAGILSLPTEPFEAAEVDGASGWQKFRMLTLPMIMPFIYTAMAIRSLDLARAYDVVQDHDQRRAGQPDRADLDLRQQPGLPAAELCAGQRHVVRHRRHQLHLHLVPVPQRDEEPVGGKSDERRRHTSSPLRQGRPPALLDRHRCATSCCISSSSCSSSRCSGSSSPRSAPNVEINTRPPVWIPQALDLRLVQDPARHADARRRIRHGRAKSRSQHMRATRPSSRSPARSCRWCSASWPAMCSHAGASAARTPSS